MKLNEYGTGVIIIAKVKFLLGCNILFSWGESVEGEPTGRIFLDWGNEQIIC